MEPTFGAENVFLALLGASSDPGRRAALLERISVRFTASDGLPRGVLHEGVKRAVDTGLITVEEARRLFGVIILEEEAGSDSRPLE
ncbi:MAG: hypothetical protein HQL59_03060 [Magnetococcales bacterium]|nr:hypothetical protein [Magnetococcales bacterium]